MGQAINDWLQVTLGELKVRERSFDDKIGDNWILLAKRLREAGFAWNGWDILEFGSGWFPALPFCFSLTGARSCKTLDIQRLLNSKLTIQMLRRLETHLDAIADVSALPREQIRAAYERVDVRQPVEQILKAAGIDYISPIDTTDTKMPSSSFDLAFTNGILQLIPQETLAAMMRELYRLLRPGGVMFHSVSCGDQYAYWDRQITPLNFLQYSEEQWRFWNNGILSQNRLRAPDYLGLAEEAGFRVIRVKRRERLELEDAAAKMRIDPAFQKYSLSDLCCTSIDFIAQR
jgi:SAM-dependent methyltransferase